MRSRWFVLLLLLLVIPMSGSTCAIKSGSNSKDGGGTKIVICNPPSAACSPKKNDLRGTNSPDPTFGMSTVIVEESGGSQNQWASQSLQASSSFVAPQPSQLSFMPPMGGAVSSIPEPGGALVFLIGALMISRHLSVRDRS